jgi:hypothetical protein
VFAMHCTKASTSCHFVFTQPVAAAEYAGAWRLEGSLRAGWDKTLEFLWAYSALQTDTEQPAPSHVWMTGFRNWGVHLHVFLRQPT